MRVKGWERAWRWVLVAVLVLFGLLRLAPGSVPASSDLKVEVPQTQEEKLVALTFDDGPRRGTTDLLLDGLKERGVKATFFLVGTQVELAPELVERMAAEGHQLGVHTFDHERVTDLTKEGFLRQVEGTRRRLYELVGERELWLRPPFGILNDNTCLWADSPIVLWSVDPEDWKDTDVQRIRSHIVSSAQDGDIILLHDIYPSSVQAALAVIDDLQAQGCRFVTVAELLESKGITPEIGQIYKRAE